MKAVFLLAPVLLLLFTLTACARPDDTRMGDARVQKLETRVATLEAQMAAMKQAMRQRSETADTASQQVTARAAAQYCATQLASTLEEYRQDNARYPQMSEVTLPSACQGFRVAWNALEQGHYRFAVSGPAGSELASERR